MIGAPALDTAEGLDQAVQAVLARAEGPVGPLSVAAALGLPAAGMADPEAVQNYRRIVASLDRVATPLRLGEWQAKRSVVRPPDTLFRLDLLGAIWGRCWMDKPARPSDLEREYGHRLGQMRDALTLLQAAGLVVLKPGRKAPRYVTTDRAPTVESKAARLVLDHVRGLGLTDRAALAERLSIAPDTAEALLRGLAQKGGAS